MCQSLNSLFLFSSPPLIQNRERTKSKSKIETLCGGAVEVRLLPTFARLELFEASLEISKFIAPLFLFATYFYVRVWGSLLQVRPLSTRFLARDMLTAVRRISSTVYSLIQATTHTTRRCRIASALIH